MKIKPTPETQLEYALTDIHLAYAAYQEEDVNTSEVESLALAKLEKALGQAQRAVRKMRKSQ